MSNVMGIDPGYRTGIAIVTLERSLISYQHTVNSDAAVAEVDRLVSEWTKHVPLYAVVQSPIFQTGKTPCWNESPVSLMKNAALSHEIIGFLRGRGVDVQVRQPTRNMGMKMDGRMFARVYNFDGRISEDARDAVNLAMSWRRDLT